MTRRYTLDEARREIQREECARDGHSPSTCVRTYANPLGWYRCECGAVTWIPSTETNREDS